MNKFLNIAAALIASQPRLTDAVRAPRVRGVHRVPADSEAGRRFVTSTNPGHQSTGHEERPGCKAAQRRLKQLERQRAKQARRA